MVKLLDRYLLDLFTNALILFLLAFIGLSLVFDFVTHLDDILSVKDQMFLNAVKYFLYKIPFYLYLLLAPITLFATIFTTTRLRTTNEMVPIVTSGISIKRVVTPFLISAFVIGVIIFSLDEWVLPRLANKIGELEGVIKNENMRYNITATDDHGNYIYAKSYETRKRRMNDLMVTVIGPNGWTLQRIYAESARWDKRSGRWVMSNGYVHPYEEGRLVIEEDPNGEERPKIKETPFGPEGHVLESGILPQTVASSGMMGPGFMTLKELLQKAEKNPHAPTFWMRLHQKLTYPLSPLILVLIGIPFVVRSEQRGIIQGLITCLLITALYYSCTFGMLELGNKMLVGPIMAAWFPTVLFGSIGAVLFLKKTD